MPRDIIDEFYSTSDEPNIDVGMKTDIPGDKVYPTRSDFHRTIKQCDSEIDALRALVRRVANLNPDAGEIGDGMLHQLVDEARRLCP